MFRHYLGLTLAFLLLFSTGAQAALSGNSIYELNASATANNVNGGGFNPANANMLTDLATTTGTNAAPTVTSATYTFVAGDVNNWVFVKSGTNWNPGWYKISSVALGVATLDASIGAAIVKDLTTGWPSPRYKANTVQGITTVNTPGGNGTFTIDYSQATAAVVNGLTNGTTTASTTYISATAGFTPVMVGNFLHQTAGTGATVGWFEVVNYTNVTTIVLDRVSGTTVNGTFYVGGAMSMNSTLDDDIFETVVNSGTEATRIFIKNGSYTWGETVSTGAAGNNRWPITVEGYNTIRGDTPSGTSRPTITDTAAWTLGTSWALHNLIITGNSSNTVTFGGECFAENIKVINTAASATALNMTNAGGICIRCEMVAGRSSIGVTLLTGPNVIIGSYIHDSMIGIQWIGSSTAGFTIANTIIADNYTSALDINTGDANDVLIINSTLYGAENKLGLGLDQQTGTIHLRVFNTILYGFTTARLHTSTTDVGGYDDYNDYFNNTTDISNQEKGPHSIALTPAFTDTTQITGSSATSSTNVLTAGSGTPFGTVEDGVDYVYLSAGTGTGIGLNKYLINSHTTTTLTLQRNITTSGSGSAISWQITTGHDFSVGSNMKAAGYPGAIAGMGTSGSTGYMDIGAIQRTEPAATVPGLQGFSTSK